MNITTCKKDKMSLKVTSDSPSNRSTLDMLDLAVFKGPSDLPSVLNTPDGLIAIHSSTYSGGSESSGMYMDKNQCWLCHCARNEDNGIISSELCDEVPKSKVGLLSEFLPWLCPDCEKTMDEEEKKAELLQLSGTSAIPSCEEICDQETTCSCEACKSTRLAEAEHEKESKELQNAWSDLCNTVQQIYSVNPKYSCTDCDQDVMRSLVERLCSHDAHQLYQRLKSQGREVVIDMKVQLLKRLTLDYYKFASGAHQFVSLLLQVYDNLCEASNKLATILSPLVEQHLNRFDLTWELHDKHLFHSIIFTDPVVQNCLPKAVENIRLSLTSQEEEKNHVAYCKTLTNYEKFVNDMQFVNSNWKLCQRHIEKYDEKQAALKVKQKMFKEDWEFFKAQRRLLEQMVPKSKHNSSHDSFERQFNQVRKILEGDKDTGYICPNCKQVRCSYDENSISHLITCGIISPEVVEESVTLEMSPCTGQLSYSGDLSTYLNVKPPSVSSGSSSGSHSPIMLDCQRFANLGASDDDAIDDNNTDDDDDDDDDFHDAEQHQMDLDDDGLPGELKQTRPSSLVARMTMAQMSGTGDRCGCPHCRLENGTSCMLSRANNDNTKKPQIHSALSMGLLLNPDHYSIPLKLPNNRECHSPDSNQEDQKGGSTELLSKGLDFLGMSSSSVWSNRAMDTSPSSWNMHQSSGILSSRDDVGSRSPSDCNQWKSEAYVDHWNGVQHRHKNNSSCLRMPEKALLNAIIADKSCCASNSENDSSESAKKSAVPSTRPNSSASASSCSDSSTCTRQHQLNPSAQGAPQIPEQSHSASCQHSSSSSGNRKAGHGTESDPQKPSSSKHFLSKYGLGSSPSTGSNCKTSSCANAHANADCERHGEESAGDGTDKAGGTLASQKDGKQHCECWHCEFFGHEAPSSLPLSKNYQERRDRLRLKLKEKKEKSCLGSSSQESLKNGSVNCSTSTGRPLSINSDMGVEEIVRFINGSDIRETSKERKAASAKKAKQKTKKAKENVAKLNGSSTSELSLCNNSMLSDLNLARETANNLESSIMKSVSETCHLPNSNIFGSSSISDAVNLLRLTCTRAEQANAKNEKSKSAVASNNATTLHHLMNGNLPMPSVVALAEMAKKSQAQQNRQTASDPVSNLNPAANPVSNSLSNPPSNLPSNPLCNAAPQDPSKVLPTKKDTGKVPSSPTHVGSMSPKPAQQSQSADLAASPNSSMKCKKNKRRNKTEESIAVDEIFLPKNCNDEEDLDDYDREIEEFKRFCLNTPPLQKREKLVVNLNLKDIFKRKKTGQGCNS